MKTERGEKAGKRRKEKKKRRNDWDIEEKMAVKRRKTETR